MNAICHCIKSTLQYVQEFSIDCFAVLVYKSVKKYRCTQCDGSPGEGVTSIEIISCVCVCMCDSCAHPLQRLISHLGGHAECALLSRGSITMWLKQYPLSVFDSG